jgi:hypothetical protein
MGFPYSYTHENPFPVFDSLFQKKLITGLKECFAEATMFLA